MKLTGRTTVAVLAMASMALVAACGPGGKTTAAGGASSPSAGSPAVDPHAAHGTYSPPPAAPLRANEHFTTVYMPKPYTPKAPNGGTDEYRCFLVDPGISRNEYLTGSQFLPQNVAIVHHAIFFRISPDDAAQAKRLDEDSPGEGWTCFGDSGVHDAPWVSSWAPGGHEVLLGTNLGYAMPPGSLLVMQVHYNLLATAGKAPGPDQSGIRLRLSATSTGMLPLQTTLLSAPVELPCAAGESGPLCERAAAVADVSHRFGPEAAAMVIGLNRYCNAGKTPDAGATQHCDRTSPGPAVIRAAAGHMHLLGRSIKIELNPGTPQARTLLDVPAYNFDDQSIRPLAAPVRIKAGDVLRVTCTHDAGLRKQLPQLRTTPARYVVWGDGTTDEMCLGVLVWTAS
jgi:Copper type II ascorbate-dependent monooxygenase, C-terminal domain